MKTINIYNIELLSELGLAEITGGDVLLLEDGTSMTLGEGQKVVRMSAEDSSVELVSKERPMDFLRLRKNKNCELIYKSNRGGFHDSWRVDSNPLGIKVNDVIGVQLSFDDPAEFLSLVEEILAVRASAFLAFYNQTVRDSKSLGVHQGGYGSNGGKAGVHEYLSSNPQLLPSFIRSLVVANNNNYYTRPHHSMLEEMPIDEPACCRVTVNEYTLFRVSINNTDCLSLMSEQFTLLEIVEIFNLSDIYTEFLLETLSIKGCNLNFFSWLLASDKLKAGK